MNIKKPSLTLRFLKEVTKKTIFTRPINKRKKELGKISYIGWNYNETEIDKSKLKSKSSKSKNLKNTNKKDFNYPYIDLYFKVEGKQYKNKNGVSKRPIYIQILQIPNDDNLLNKHFRDIFDIPIRVFSSDPSFKYFLAYVLNSKGSVVITKDTIKWLGVALTKRPRKKNRTLHSELNKHFYKLTEYIFTKQIKKFIQDKYFLKTNTLK